MDEVSLGPWFSPGSGVRWCRARAGRASSPAAHVRLGVTFGIRGPGAGWEGGGGGKRGWWPPADSAQHALLERRMGITGVSTKEMMESEGELNHIDYFAVVRLFIFKNLAYPPIWYKEEK